ncbi:hypothetical protein FDECE_11751 [Fusarium decemcellulare]|nr:hypothetical protein FDECE_11751 [Fusarium decemcellulare]
MAEAFGIGAGAVGVVGLTIQISQVVVQFGLDWKDAPKNIKTFIDEIQNLNAVLSQIDSSIRLNPDYAAAFRGSSSILFSPLGNPPSGSGLKSPLEICQDELTTMLTELKRKRKDQHRSWERLKNTFLAKNTRDAVEGLHRQYRTLHDTLMVDAALLGSDTSKEIKEAIKKQYDWHQEEMKATSAIRDGVDQLHEGMDQISKQQSDSHHLQMETSLALRNDVSGLLFWEKRRAVLDWITSIDYTCQQSDLLRSRQPGAGRWLLESANFKEWLETGSRTLFCPGIPGAGKTTLTSIVVDDLETRFSGSREVGIAYVYCDFRQQNFWGDEDLLASLLKQLAQGRQALPDSVTALYDNHKQKATRPTLGEISTTLRSVARLYSQVFIAVDALDEFQTPDNYQTILGEILSLRTVCKANVFSTARFIPEITKYFDAIESLVVEIRADPDDVRRYVDAHISHLPFFVRSNPALQEEIKTEIVRAMDGMFLLARLQLDSLIGKRSLKAVRACLSKLPTGTEAYGRAYEEAMERIERQVVDREDLAKQVLSWLTHEKRPLSVTELQHALAVEVGDRDLDETNLPYIEDMVSACVGLVTVDRESDIVRLVHRTTQEYFVQTWKRWFPNAENDITATCVTYLSFDTFGRGSCPTDEAFEQRLEQYPLYDYAARNWGHHARAASANRHESILRFLQDDAKLSASVQAANVSEYSDYYSHYDGYSQEVPSQMGCVHVAAYFGLREEMETLLEGTIGPNIQDSWGRTPLSLAAENGHGSIVRRLLERDGIDPDPRGAAGRTPLSLAAENGHSEVVECLLSRNDVDPDSHSHQTPLSWAAENGHCEVVRLLLADGRVDPNDRHGWFGQTPLLLASHNGHEDVVRLLLAKDGVCINQKDKGGRTPLSHAAEEGHEAIVKLLLAQDKIDPDSISWGRRTPLSYAAEGHEAIVKLLLIQDNVNPDSKPDDNGRTPLSYAAEGHDGVVKLLLAQDNVDPDSKSHVRRTPLSYAAEGHEAVVKLLLSQDSVDPDSETYDGRTPLSFAAAKGDGAVVKILITEGADLDSKDDYGRTPLSYGAEGGSKAVVELLLAENVDIDPRDRAERTPLSYAAGNGCADVAMMLLARDDVCADSNDKAGRTPLSYAAKNRSGDIAALLLTRDDVCADSKDEAGRTPLSHAAEWGRDEVVMLLLAREDINGGSKDKEGRTPLSWAASRSWLGETVSALLLAREDVELNSKDNNGWTPLLRAASSYCENMVPLLLAQDTIDIDAANNHGRTALSLAADNGHVEAVKLLLEKGGADLNSRDDGNRTPLLYAAEGGHEAVVELLLATNGVDVNAKDNRGRTPLLLAVKRNHKAVARALLSQDGIDPNYRDNDDWTPLLLASSKPSQSKEMVELLLAMDNIDLNSRDKDGRTPLLWTSQTLFGEELVRLLLAQGNIDPDVKDKDGRTALSHAAAEGNGEVVELLLDTEGVDLNSLDENGWTPLALASSHKHDAVVRLLLDKGADPELGGHGPQEDAAIACPRKRTPGQRKTVSRLRNYILEEEIW